MRESRVMPRDKGRLKYIVYKIEQKKKELGKEGKAEKGEGGKEKEREEGLEAG